VWVLSDMVIETAVDHNSRGGNTRSRNGLRVRGNTKEIIVAVLLRCRTELRCRSFGSRGNVGDDNNLIGILEFLKVGGCDLRNRRKGLSGRMRLAGPRVKK